MSVFWLILSVLLVGASALLLLAGWRNPGAGATDRNALNKSFYHQRLAELAEDEAQGVVAERPEMVRELQQTLLTDIPEEPQPLPGRVGVGRWVLLPGVLVIFIVSLGVYYKTGGLPRVIEFQQVKNELPALRARVMDPNATPLTMEELARLSLGVRSSLQNDPQNINDWMLLGRLGMVLNNATTATQAFQHALTLAPNNPEIKLSYAEVLTRSSDPEDNREGGIMLSEMLKTDHANERILGLLAFNAFEQQQYDRAIGAWQMMLRLLPADDRRIEMIQRSIEQAKSESGKQNSQLALTVNLSPEAEKMLPEGGVLYISVSDGDSPVPVAVKKLPLSHFPLSLTLDDSNAMMPGRLLSSQQKVQVQVRISRDGSADSRPGDWLGISAVTPYDGHQQFAVEINHQQP